MGIMLGPIFMGVSHTWKLPFMYWNQQMADYYAGHCRLQIHELNWQFKWQFAFLIPQLPNYVLWCLKWFQPSLLQSWKDQNDEIETLLYFKRNKNMFVDTIFSSLYPMRNWQCGEAAFLLPLWTREITL